MYTVALLHVRALEQTRASVHYQRQVRTTQDVRPSLLKSLTLHVHPQQLCLLLVRSLEQIVANHLLLEL